MKIHFNFSVWLIETLLTKASTLADIQRKWQYAAVSRDGKELTERSFNRYRRYAEDMFQISIRCNRSNGNKYEIVDRDSILNNKILSWQLMSFRMDKLANDIKNKDFVVLDTEAPATHFLEPIFQAIDQNISLKIRYKSHYKDAKTVNFTPVFVRLWGQRWYLIGIDMDQNAHRVYALERILDLTLSEKLPKNVLKEKDKIDATTYFYTSFGVITEGKAEFIQIRAYWPQNAYLKDVPLHHSQQVIAETADYTDFELYLKPTYDFIQAILGQREQVQVLAPESVKEELKQVLNKMLVYYC